MKDETVIAMTLAMRNRWVMPEGTGWSVLVGTLVSKAYKRRTVSVVVQVGELVAPLGDDAQGILEESDDDEETANGRDVAAALSVAEESTKGSRTTHGLTGCDKVSSQSSILLVCSRMASSGLGSLVASGRPGFPKEGCEPRWYPAVPLI